MPAFFKGLVLIILLIATFSFIYFDEAKSIAAETGHPKPQSIWATEWSKDGRYIAVGGDDSTLWLYHGADFSLYKRLPLSSMIKGLSWHPRENLLAIATMMGVALLNVENGKLVTVAGLSTGGRALGWNFSGELLALADGHGILQIMTKAGNLIRSLKKHNNHSYATMDWHPSKNIIVTGSDEIIIFDTSGAQLAFFRHRPENTLLLSARWHPSGEFLATGDYGHENEGKPTLLQFWSHDGRLIKQLTGHHKEIRNIRWNKDGSALATASDGLRIWSRDGALLHETPTSDVLWGISWSNDNRRIATGSYSNGAIRLWTNEAKLVRIIN